MFQRYVILYATTSVNDMMSCQDKEKICLFLTLFLSNFIRIVDVSTVMYITFRKV